MPYCSRQFPPPAICGRSNLVHGGPPGESRVGKSGRPLIHSLPFVSQKIRVYVAWVRVIGDHGRCLGRFSGHKAKDLVARGVAIAEGKRGPVKIITILNPATNDENEVARNSRASQKFTYRDPQPHNPFLISMKRYDEESGLYVRYK